MIKIALYVSCHGYGHASRISALAEEFIGYGFFCHIISEKPEFLYSNLNPEYVVQHHRSLDFGVVHEANLKVNKEATISKLLQLMVNRNSLMEEELKFLREEGIDLIIADIPFLIADIAGYAKIPVFALSNFEWHYIYSLLFADREDLLPVFNTIWALYQRVDYFFRLPFSTDSSVAAFTKGENCGLLARRKNSYADLRKSWNLSAQEQILLVMFGGEGAMEMDYEALCAGYKGKVVSTNKNVRAANHLLVNKDGDFLDLVYNADIILCKPGYSTLAEAVQMGKFIIYCPRNNYPEETALIDGLRNYPNSLRLDSMNLVSEKWRQVFSGITTKKVNNAKFRNSNSKVAGAIISRYIKSMLPDAKLLSVFDLGTNSLNYTLFDAQTRKVLHKVHLNTGLGRGFNNGKLSNSRIKSVQQIINPLLELDSRIDSEKIMLATGVSRLAANVATLQNWVTKNHKIEFRIIPEIEEIRYVYYAAQKVGKREEGRLAVDLGGSSTEIIQFARYDKYAGICVPLGLLSLLQTHGTNTETARMEIETVLQQLDFNQTERIIGIGLTFTYLAAVIMKKTPSHAMNFNHEAITLKQLEILYQAIESGNGQEYLPYLLSGDYVPILKLSTIFCISLLARFNASEIVVCDDGISVGYALWKTKQGKK